MKNLINHEYKGIEEKIKNLMVIQTQMRDFTRQIELVKLEIEAKQQLEKWILV